MKLHFKKYGEGAPLLVIHGLLGSLDNWASLGKKWASQYTVYLIDQRNHGRSPWSDDHSYELMAEDLRELMDDEGLEKAHILGHSMGGKTAMCFATQYPHRVDQLVIVDIGPKYYPPHHESIFQGIFNVDFDTDKDRKAVEEKLQAFIPEIGVRQFIMKSLHWAEKNRLGWRFNARGLYDQINNIGESLEDKAYFTNPVLFIDGANSNYILEEDHELIYQIFPRAEIEEVEDAGHWVHAENPSRFSEVLLEFLEE